MESSKLQAQDQAAMEHPVSNGEEMTAMEHPKSDAEQVMAKPPQAEEEETIEYPKPRPRLAAIDDSESHRFMLKEFQREAKFLETDYDWKLASCERSKADLVTILGLNFAFQGLLLSGVAPSQTIVCRHSPTVCVVSAIASLGACYATLHKLQEMASNKERRKSQKKHMAWQNARINELKEQGEDFVFENMPPFNLGVSDISGEGLLESWVARARMLLNFWVWSQYGAILGLLIAFSVGIVVCIQLLLCT